MSEVAIQNKLMLTFYMYIRGSFQIWSESVEINRGSQQVMLSLLVVVRLDCFYGADLGGKFG